MNNDTVRGEIELLGGQARLPAKLTIVRAREITTINLRVRKTPANAVLHFDIQIGKISPLEFNAHASLLGTFTRRDPQWEVNTGGDITVDYRFKTYFSTNGGKYTGVFRWVEPNFF